jgi:hypothetical protein
MKPTVASWPMALAVLCFAGEAWSWPELQPEGGLAKSPPAEVVITGDPQRVVVVEGDRKTIRFLNELEEELKASSYVVVREPAVVPFEPAAMLQTLRRARASHGIVVSQDGRSVAVLGASDGGTTLRECAKYSVDRENRLARRRQWISLVERLRVPAEDSDDTAEETAGMPAAASAPPAVTVAEGGPSGIDVTGVETSNRRVPRLGASAALGYVTGRTGITSHLMITGHLSLSPRVSILVTALWPMVPGEKTPDNGLRSRVWTFSAAGGLVADLGQPSWLVNPFLGATIGMQFLLAYVESSKEANSDVYRVASLTTDVHVGLRVSLRPDTWLLIETIGGRLTSLATRPGEVTDSLAQAWAVRTAVGLLMAL